MNDVIQPERGRGSVRSVVAMVAALVALLAFAPFASAASDPLASGTTTVTINKGLFKKLKKAGVKVLKVSPATVKKRTVKLPVLGGSLDPTNGLGTIEHSGGIKFKHGKRKAVVNTLVLETSTSSLKAKVAGKSMKLATVKGTAVARNGFGANVSITALKLTGKAAKQLNKKLGFTGKKKKKAPFKGNKSLGASVSETQPKTVTVLATGKARLATNEGTVKKFSLAPPNGNAVKIEPISPTEAEAGPSLFAPILVFPISGGTIAPNASSGVVQTGGGVRLVQTVAPEKTTTMTLGNIWIDLGAKTATVEVTVTSTISPQLNLGNLGRSSIADLNLTAATIKSDPSARTVTVENATATLQAITADTLNSVFGAPFDASEPPIPHPKFAAGDPLGTFSFTVQTQ
jgi:Htaa